MKWSALNDLSNQQLLDEVRTFAARERTATADLIAALMEMDSRKLYLGEGFSSLFTFCTQALRLSEHAAYGRIEAVRAARQFPIVLDLLADGAVTLTTVCLLGPHLTADNHREVLESARHKSKREVEQIVAALRPRPPVPTTVRKLPMPKALDGAPRMVSDAVSEAPALPRPASLPPPPRPAVVVPLAPEVYRIQFTMSREMHERLREAQDLLRHVIPNGDPATVFDRALTLLLEDLRKARHAATCRPRDSRRATKISRHVPASVKREVWQRDGGQCAFVGTRGRCTERGFLEYHHRVPHAAGGPTTAGNLELRCRAHNQHEANLFFGPLIVRETRAEWRRSTRSGPS